MMLSIFSCAYLPYECHLWRNVYSGLLPIFQLGSLFFWCWVVCVVCLFWRLSPCWGLIICNYFFPFPRLSLWLFFFLSFFLSFFFPPVVSFAVEKFLSLIRSHWFIFLFISTALGGWPKNLYSCCQRMFCLYSLLGVLWCLVLYISL